MENDILTAALETPAHQGRLFSSLGWVKGLMKSLLECKEEGKRSDDMMDITFKRVVHCLRLSNIEIPKNVLLPS
jgi:hypothetical protein